MPITTRTVTVYTCDRCGFQSENAFERAGSCGTLKPEYQQGNKNGGTSESIKSQYLCGYCINAFRRFMHGDPTPGIEKED